MQSRSLYTHVAACLVHWYETNACKLFSLLTWLTGLTRLTNTQHFNFIQPTIFVIIVTVNLVGKSSLKSSQVYSCTWWLRRRLYYSLGFVKSTCSIGCVGAQSNAPVYSNAGEPTRPCTSGIDYFGAVTSVVSSTGNPSRPSCAANLVPQEQQCAGDCCSTCRISLETISECLNFQIFLEEGMEACLPNEIASYAYALCVHVCKHGFVKLTVDYSKDQRGQQWTSTHHHFDNTMNTSISGD